MDTGRAGTPPEYLVNANERQYLAKLCWLLHDAGTHALRATFDSFHPPLSLRHHLAQLHVRSVLQRLVDQKVRRGVLPGLGLEGVGGRRGAGGGGR